MVITVKNEFASGEFKQTLELVRRPQQSPKPTAQAGEKGNQEIVDEKADVNKQDDVKNSGIGGEDDAAANQAAFEKNIADAEAADAAEAKAKNQKDVNNRLAARNQGANIGF
jgi:hypothetical protein